MRILFFPGILFLLVAGNLNAQSPDTVFIRQDKNFDDTLIYVNDTVTFESGMTKCLLVGTTVLPGTHNQMEARGYGLWLKSISASPCKGSVEYPDESSWRINSIVNTDSTLVIDINIIDNCCYNFLGDIQVDSSGVLHLLSYGYGTYCSCDCCFGLTYHLTKVKFSDYKEINAVMIGENRKTLRVIKK